MKKRDRAVLDSQPPVDLEAVVKELNAIKRLLAVALLRDGAPQQQVARAACVAKLTINELAQSGGVAKSNHNSKVKKG